MNTAAKVISGFPGIGKSYYWYRHIAKDGSVIDLDSSEFRWLSEKNKLKNSDFPQNYIDHIKKDLETGVDTILVSSHQNVRDALVANKIWFWAVYPSRELKEEYLNRYWSRSYNSSDVIEFVTMLDRNWDSFITSLENQVNCHHVVLKSEQYLSDIL